MGIREELGDQKPTSQDQILEQLRAKKVLWLMAYGEWHHCHSNFLLITLSFLSFGQSSNYPTGFVKK